MSAPDELPVGGGSSSQSFVRLRWVEQQGDELALLQNRQSNDVLLLEFASSGVPSGRDHEVAQAAALGLSRTLDEVQHFRRDPSFNSMGAGSRVAGSCHWPCTVRLSTVHAKCGRVRPPPAPKAISRRFGGIHFRGAAPAPSTTNSRHGSPLPTAA